MLGGEWWLGGMSRGAPRADAPQGRAVGASGVCVHVIGGSQPRARFLCTLYLQCPKN